MKAEPARKARELTGMGVGLAEEGGRGKKTPG